MRVPEVMRWTPLSILPSYIIRVGFPRLPTKRKIDKSARHLGEVTTEWWPTFRFH